MMQRTLGGVPVEELVATYGTPLVAVDVDVFDLERDRFERAFVARGITVAYAGKAFLCAALAELLAATPLWLDVCSLGELVTAERGGMPPGRIYAHGAGKTAEELDAIAAGRVAFSVVDHAVELEALAARGTAEQPIPVMLRLNTGIEAHTHEFIRTGGENTKFGFSTPAFAAALDRLAALPMLRLIGLHSHVGSQISDPAPLLENVDALIAAAQHARGRGFAADHLIAGGGMGVEERPGDPAPIDVDALGRAMSQRARASGFSVGVEPGRALIARAGTTLYRVVTTKLHGKRRFVIIDGGMADNPRPLLYGARHYPEVVHSRAGQTAVPTTIAGRACENDEIGEFDLPPDLAPGDIIAMHGTGAYTYSMASNYNRFTRPAVIFVRDGAHRRVIRAETIDDIVRYDMV